MRRRRYHVVVPVLVAVLVPTPATTQSWTAPRTWTTGELVSAALMNTHVRDNLTVLRAGGLAVTSQAAGDLLCASTATQVGRVAAVGSGSVLVSAGASTCPTYSNTPAISTLSVTTQVLMTGTTTPHILMNNAGTNFILGSVASSIFQIDTDNNGVEAFYIRNGSGSNVVSIDENGTLTLGNGTTFNQHVLQGSTGAGVQYQRTAATAQTWETRTDSDGNFKLIDVTDASASVIEFVKATGDIKLGAGGTGGAVPSGLIALFDASCPTGWTRFTALDNTFPRGAATYGGTGGASTHDHNVNPPNTSTTSDAGLITAGSGADLNAAGSHSHSVDIAGFYSATASSLPPFVDMVFCKRN